MNIKVYGACCATCHATYDAVKEAAANIDSQIEVEHIGDIMEILKNHIVQTPAVVIDGKCVCGGQRLTVAEAEKLIRDNMK